MAGITSKVSICNLALGHLGNYGTINDIDSPMNDKEKTFALWYDISRQTLLKMTMPNFALARREVALTNDIAGFGYTNVYEYPSDCLKVLGIGEIEEKDNNYTVETNSSGTSRVYTNMDYPLGLPLRFIRDVTEVNAMSADFKMLLSWYLADNTCLSITQDLNKKQLLEKLLPQYMANLSSLNAQENPPIRITNSRFRQARYHGRLAPYGKK